MTIITRKIKEEICWFCNGTGIDIVESDACSDKNKKICQKCSGSGLYTEYMSYYIDDDQKIAIDRELGQ